MSLTITGTTAADQAAPRAAPPPKEAPEASAATGAAAGGGAGKPVSNGIAGGQAPGGSAGTSTTQQQAALKQLQAKYVYDQMHGVDARTLSARGKQIIAAAKALGQTVTLPTAPPSSAAAPAATARSGAGIINVRPDTNGPSH
jgi:hypothetical protein